jgi:viologen exporter family transport system permease protein
VTRGAWRISRIVPLGELLSRGRLIATALRLALQITLVVCLWDALYAHTAINSGLTRHQAVNYAVLAVLVTRTRGVDRQWNRDSVNWHVYTGTIVYWFLRPVSPRRYYLYRALGEQAYDLLWTVLGYTVCRLAGIIGAPASSGSAAGFVATLLLGQAVYYELTLMTDLMCFWTVQNSSALTVLRFAQNLLSGAYAPLWYFPGWFIAMSAVLPFAATLNSPLSLYIGRLGPVQAGGQLLTQAAWAAGLWLCNQALWRRAALRVASQGG